MHLLKTCRAVTQNQSFAMTEEKYYSCTCFTLQFHSAIRNDVEVSVAVSLEVSDLAELSLSSKV